MKKHQIICILVYWFLFLMFILEIFNFGKNHYFNCNIQNYQTNIPIKQKSNSNNYFKNFYVLGDSLSDEGNLSQTSQMFYRNESLVSSRLKDKYQSFFPLGPFENFMKMTEKLIWPSEIILNSPYYENRSFSNGPIAVEILSKKLGFTSRPSYYYENFLQKSYYVEGNNFAIGGARLTEGKNIQDLFLNNFTIFKQAQGLIKLQKIQQSQLTERDLIYINGGANDVISLWDDNAPSFLRQTLNKWIEFPNYFTDDFNVQEEAETMFQQLKQTINMLAYHGAKNFIISNLPDVTKTPRITKSSNIDGHEQLSNKIRQIIDYFNQKIIDFKMASDLDIMIFDMNAEFDKILDEWHQKAYRASVINYGIAEYITRLNIKINITPHPQHESQYEINDYFFIDELHPTAWVNERIAEAIFELISKKHFFVEDKDVVKIISFFDKWHYWNLTTLHKVSHILTIAQNKIRELLPNYIVRDLQIILADDNISDFFLLPNNQFYEVKILFKGVPLSQDNLDIFRLKIHRIIDVQAKVIDLLKIKYNLNLSFIHTFADAINIFKNTFNYFFPPEIRPLIKINLDKKIDQTRRLAQHTQEIQLEVSINSQSVFVIKQYLTLQIVKIIDVENWITDLFTKEYDLNLDIRDIFRDALYNINRKIQIVLHPHIVNQLILRISGIDLNEKLSQSTIRIPIQIVLSNRQGYHQIIDTNLKVKDIKRADDDLKEVFDKIINLQLSTINTYRDLINRVKLHLRFFLSKKRFQFLNINILNFALDEKIHDNPNIKLTISWADAINMQDLIFSLKIDKILNFSQIIHNFVNQKFNLKLSSLDNGATAVHRIKEKLYNDLINQNFAIEDLCRIDIDLKFAWHEYILNNNDNDFFTLQIMVDNVEFFNVLDNNNRFRLNLIDIFSFQNSVKEAFNKSFFLPFKHYPTLMAIKNKVIRNLTDFLLLHMQFENIDFDFIGIEEEKLCQEIVTQSIDQPIIFKIKYLLYNADKTWRIANETIAVRLKANILIVVGKK